MTITEEIAMLILQVLLLGVGLAALVVGYRNQNRI